ncbi:hypothetical protein KQH65_09915 [archaeon]|nr:hypothetical protein [archaeon]
MFNLISRLKEPAIFQGNLQKKKYFEGWYFKQSDQKGETKLAIIPGVSLTSEDKHAFIQVFDGVENKAHYIKYPLSMFKPGKSPFSVTIGKNRFSYTGIELDIDEEIRVKGKLDYTNQTRFRAPRWMRGIMGFYGYVPFMETYHGLLSLDHTVDGAIKIDDSSLRFQNARGYIEKDWGTSFPSAWIWMQGNCFKKPKTSIMISVAVIPWLGSSFIGHLAILLHEDKLINLSTYAGGKISVLKKKQNGVMITLESRTHRLEIDASQGEAVDLKSPEKGVMTGKTVESLSSSIKLKLIDKKRNTLVYSGETLGAGLEIMDPQDHIIKKLDLP